ncbi:MAG: hypothetical protein ACK5WR_14060 [Planctomycetaceae bacterium]
MAAEIEDCFQSMANSAATASGGLQGLGPIDKKRIGMDLPALGSERVPQKRNNGKAIMGQETTTLPVQVQETGTTTTG